MSLSNVDDRREFHRYIINKSASPIPVTWYLSNQLARKDATRPKAAWYNEICQIKQHLSTIRLKHLIVCLKGKEDLHANMTQCILNFLLETLFSQWLWWIRMGEDQVGSDSLMEIEKTKKLFYLSPNLFSKMKLLTRI